MLCPVCRGPATDISAKDYDGISIRCRLHDHDFNIIGAALNAFGLLDLDGRRSVLARARRVARRRGAERPTITPLDVGPCASEG